MSFANPNPVKDQDSSIEVKINSISTIIDSKLDTSSMVSPPPPPYLVHLTAKYGKDRYELHDLDPTTTTVQQVKNMLYQVSKILPIRQKLIGLMSSASNSTREDMLLMDIFKSKEWEKKKLKWNGTLSHSFILMGTPEEQIFIDPNEKDDLPDVIDDFDLDFVAGSDEWYNHVATDMNLKKFTEMTVIHIMNEPRPNKPLLVLDLDHTLLDFSSRKLMQAPTADIGDDHTMQMKRPFMDHFLSSMYVHFDLVVWSQTSWKWLEIKLIELGMLTHPNYRFCFVLDKTSMFAITSTKRDGNTSFQHHVKPLQIIWSKFPQWGEHNTIHLDDLSRNFALNLQNGLKVTPFYRKSKSSRSSSALATNSSRSRSSNNRNMSGKNDVELLGIGQFLEQLASFGYDFCDVNLNAWLDVVSGKKVMSEILLKRKHSKEENSGKKDS